MKKIFLLLLVTVSLFAFADSDMDGVPNSLDKCPNTPITDLVGSNGCPIKSLVSANHYDIVVGADFGQSDYQLTPKTNTYASTLQVDYYHKAFSLQLSTLYYNTKASNYSSSGIGDTTVAGYYSFYPSKNFILKLGVGAILPTYKSILNNNKTDYLGSLFATYQMAKYSIFGGYTYTLINDTNINSSSYQVNYQNTNAYNVGLGYNVTSNFYTSLSYYTADSFYQGVQNLQSVSLYLFYSINRHWFTSLSGAIGLNQATSKNYSSFKLGYYF